MFWCFVLPALLLALLALTGEGARARYVRAALARRQRDEECPPATVIVPVKGWDEGLRENLAALACLDYPDYELIVCARGEGDVPPGVVPARARVVLAGPGDPDRGEKINNLMAAVRAARPDSAVLAFADSDGQVRAGWLRALVMALDEERTGAASGYRWHTPLRITLWTLLRSVWNAAIAGGFGPGDNRFAWGGAMAIRRDTFFRLHVPDFWRGTVSDDYGLTAAVKRAGLRIAFAPGAMVASSDGTRGREFLGWIRRQMTITRVYSPRLWWLGFLSHLFYCGAMVACVGRGGWMGWGLLTLQLGLGLWKGRNRLELARQMLPEQREWFARWGWTHIWLVPVGTWVWLYSFLSSAWSNVIHWRGYRHKLVRPRHAEGESAAA